jgi:hypothetical protein
MIPALDKKAISMIVAGVAPSKSERPMEKEEPKGDEEFDAEKEIMNAFMKSVMAGDAKRALTNFKRLLDVCNMDYESEE